MFLKVIMAWSSYPIESFIHWLIDSLKRQTASRQLSALSERPSPFANILLTAQADS
jgi:hypothetical protein